MTFSVLTLIGCTAFDVTGEYKARWGRARAQDPYYGKGTVAHVIGTDLVDVTFASSPLPRVMAKLIVVRNNVVIAKVKFNGGGFDH